MFVVPFIFTIVIAFVVADEKQTTEENICELQRRSSISNFLHAEKGRTFANHFAEWDTMQGNLKHVRWLPIFYEDDKKFSHFFLLEGNFTANLAFDACQRLDGAELASLHTPERLEFVNKNLVAGNYWIGLHRWDDRNLFTWSNGDALSETSTHWFQTEPKEAGKGFNCVRTVTPTDMICNATYCHSKSFASWSSESCDKTYGFSALCETTYVC